MSQCFSITVPNTNVTIQGGTGPVDGISLTTDGSVFGHAGVEVVLESVADMRHATTGALGAAATGGILIGTPATIQHSAGGGIQIYAGAGITPSLGSASGPGAGFEASKAPDTGAGKVADRLNAFNDAVKGASDVYSGVTGYTEAKDTVGKASAAFGAAKGAWDATKGALGAADLKPEKDSTLESVMKGTDEVFKYAGVGMSGAGVINTFKKGDSVGGKAGAAGFVGTMAGLVRSEMVKANQEEVKANYGAQLKAAQEAAAAKMVCGVPGATVVPPADGARIHEVAPANIDRECGGDMTAKVGGDKTTTVDGSINYKSGNSVSVKAFAGISTSSMTFSAHANISAAMKGLATAKVESLGSASLSGKAKFTVDTKGSGTVDAKGKLTIKSGGKLDMSAGGVMTIKSGGVMALRGSDVGVSAKGKVQATAPNIILNGTTEVKKTLKVRGSALVEKASRFRSTVRVDGNMVAKDVCKFG